MKRNIFFLICVSMSLTSIIKAEKYTITNDTGRDMLLLWVEYTKSHDVHIPIANNSSYTINTSLGGLDWITYGYETSNPDAPYQANTQRFDWNSIDFWDEYSFTLIDCGNDIFSAIPTVIDGEKTKMPLVCG